jgi:ParB family protein
LLDTLATANSAPRRGIAAEGWRWIDAALDFPYGHTTGLRRITGERPELSADEQAAYEALTEELDRLYAEHDDGEDLPEAVDLRLEESRRRSPASRTGRPSTIRPRSRAPAPSSASTARAD